MKPNVTKHTKYYNINISLQQVFTFSHNQPTFFCNTKNVWNHETHHRSLLICRQQLCGAAVHLSAWKNCFCSVWKLKTQKYMSPWCSAFQDVVRAHFLRPFAIALFLFVIFAELKCNDDDDDESSCNSLCQFLYHCHCLLLSLYICVISLKCNGKVGLKFGVSSGSARGDGVYKVWKHQKQHQNP